MLNEKAKIVSKFQGVISVNFARNLNLCQVSLYSVHIIKKIIPYVTLFEKKGLEEVLSEMEKIEYLPYENK